MYNHERSTVNNAMKLFIKPKYKQSYLKVKCVSIHLIKTLNSSG